MKKLSIVVAIGLSLSACADKDSDFARKYQNKDKTATTQGGTLDKTSAEGNQEAQLLCQSPEKIVCDIKVATVSTSIKDEGFAAAVKQTQEKLSLGEDFKGQAEDINKLEETQRAAVQKELLLAADQNYRQIHDYNADLLEAGEIVRDLALKAIEAKELNADDKMKARGTVNLLVFQTLQEAFTTDYLNATEARKKILEICGLDGLGTEVYSITSESAPNSLIGACPGFLLQASGKDKDQRIAQLVFALAAQVGLEIKMDSLQKDNKTLVCLETDSKVDSSVLSADLFAAEIAQNHLQSASNKVELTAQMLNSLCQSGKEEDKARLANFFKLESTAKMLGCEQTVRCETIKDRQVNR